MKEVAVMKQWFWYNENNLMEYSSLDPLLFMEPEILLPFSEDSVLVPVLRHMNPGHTLTFCLYENHFNIILSYTPDASK
jgi:hypothetical protein